MNPIVSSELVNQFTSSTISKSEAFEESVIRCCNSLHRSDKRQSNLRLPRLRLK